jgi:hypothetical protein
MARAYFENERDRLLTHPYITTKDEPTRRRFRAILASTIVEGASAWLFALPNGGMCQRMTALEFQAAICFRLLMPQFALGSVCHQRECGAALDVYGYHSLVCRGHLLPRHNLVRDALFDLMVKARFNPIKDAAVSCLGHRSGQLAALRPADILMAGDDFDQDCVDVTIVSPLTTNNQAEVVVGKAAADAEVRKYDKHMVPCEQAGFGFKAFAADVFGVLTPKSYSLLRRIWTRLIREAGYPKYRAVAMCLRRVSFAIQLGVARQFVASRLASV